MNIPPPVDQSPEQEPGQLVEAPLSFQAASGMYFKAEVNPLPELPELQ